MALSGNSKTERKLVNQFLRGEQRSGGTVLDDIAAQISQGRASRAQQRTINRAIGTGPWQGNTPFGAKFNPSMVNPTGATPASVTAQPLALEAGNGGRQLATIQQRAKGSVPRGLPAGPQQPIQATYGDRVAGSLGQKAPHVAGRATAAEAAASGTAGNAARVAGRVAASPVDDIIMSVGTGGMTGAEALKALGVNTPAARTGIMAKIASSTNISRASVGQGIGAGMAGIVASGFIDGLDVGGENSDFDRILSGGTLGAGLGAGGALALGLGSGPVGWAALGGAAMFGGYKYLFGDKETTSEKMQQSVDETRQSIQDIAGMYGLTGGALNDIMLQYDVSTKLYMNEEDKDGMKAYLAGLTQTLPAMMLQQKQEADLKRQEENRYKNMIQTQAAFAPIFESQLTRAGQASETAMQYANETASRMEAENPNLAALIRQSSAQSAESSQRLYAAYAQQMAMSPGRAADTQDLEARLAQQQALQQQMANPIG